MPPRFNGVELTPDTIQSTREHFADIHRRCIEGAKAGEWHVNDLDKYVVWQEQCIRESLEGLNDHTFTFLQRAHCLQTGECVPLLSA